MPFKKSCKLDILTKNQMEVTSIIVTSMKELMAILGSDLKNMVFANTENKERLRKLKEDNQVLKQKTNAILDILYIMNEKLE